MKFVKILLFVILAHNSLLFALSNEILADKYLIGAKKYIKTKEYKKAIVNFEKIFDLGVKVPDDIYYFYAKTLKNDNQLKKSLKNFNLYIEKTGRNSTHYQESLSYMIDLEDTIDTKEKNKSRVLVDDSKKLMWQDNDDKQRVSKNWWQANDYCNNLVLDNFSDWYLPSKKQFESLWYKRDKLKFKKHDGYWLSSRDTRFSSKSREVFFFKFDGGGTNSYQRKYKLNIRCVRNIKSK